MTFSTFAVSVLVITAMVLAVLAAYSRWHLVWLWFLRYITEDAAPSKGVGEFAFGKPGGSVGSNQTSFKFATFFRVPMRNKSRRGSRSDIEMGKCD